MRKGWAVGLVALAISAAQSPKSSTEKVAWLKANGVPVRSLIPGDEDFSDLRPLAQAIGDARVVMLGATSARNGEIANRLVRFLHQEMGFDVLVSEASFFDTEDVELAWDRRAVPDRAAILYAQSGFHRGKLTVPTYLLATHHSQHPLHLAGTGMAEQRPRFAPSPRKRLVDQLFAAIDRVAPHAAIAGDRKTIGSLLALVHIPGDRSPWQRKESVWNARERVLNRLIDVLGRVPPDSPDGRESSLIQYTLIKLRYECLRLARPPRAVGPEPPTDALVWIAKVWRPESKIVVWSRNDRIGRNTALAKELGAKVYSLAFDKINHESDVPVVLEGGSSPSLKPLRDDLDTLLHAVDNPCFFIDFRNLPGGHWLREPTPSRILYSSAEVRNFVLITEPTTMAWPDRYDGVISIDATISRGRTKR